MGRSHTPLHVESFGWNACLTSRVKFCWMDFRPCRSLAQMEWWKQHRQLPAWNSWMMRCIELWISPFARWKKERCQSECLQHVSLVIIPWSAKSCQKQNYLFTLVFLPSSWQEFQFVHWKFNFWNFGVVAWNLSKWSGTDSALNSLACKIFMWKFWAKKKCLYVSRVPCAIPTRCLEQTALRSC